MTANDAGLGPRRLSRRKNKLKQNEKKKKKKTASDKNILWAF